MFFLLFPSEARLCFCSGWDIASASIGAPAAGASRWSRGGEGGGSRPCVGRSPGAAPWPLGPHPRALGVPATQLRDVTPRDYVTRPCGHLPNGLSASPHRKARPRAVRPRRLRFRFPNSVADGTRGVRTSSAARGISTRRTFLNFRRRRGQPQTRHRLIGLQNSLG